jgi:ribosomal protein S18 acetylase RimI-like enzyme
MTRTLSETSDSFGSARARTRKKFENPYAAGKARRRIAVERSEVRLHVTGKTAASSLPTARACSRVVAARDGGVLVGLARVVSHGVSICYLQDVLVRREFQHRGIGRALVRAVLEPSRSVRQKVLLTDDERPSEPSTSRSATARSVTSARHGYGRSSASTRG